MGFKLLLCSKRRGDDYSRSDNPDHMRTRRHTTGFIEPFSPHDDYDNSDDIDEPDYEEEARRGRRGRRRGYRTRYEDTGMEPHMGGSEYSGDRMGFGAGRPIHRQEWPSPHKPHLEHRIEQMEAATSHLGGVDPMANVIEDAMGVMSTPPKTWEPYIQKKDWSGIAKMEVKELQRALEAGKSPVELKKELSHTIAALLKMFNS